MHVFIEEASQLLEQGKESVELMIAIVVQAVSALSFVAKIFSSFFLKLEMKSSQAAARRRTRLRRKTKSLTYRDLKAKF